jgi:hypothetical protein
MDMKDLEKYSSPNIPSFHPSEALEVVSTEMPGVQCIDFAVRSFRHHHLVPVMDLTLALNGNRWLAEGIAVKMGRVFEAWCYGEMCRELKVPLERAKETTNRNLLEGLQ